MSSSSAPLAQSWQASSSSYQPEASTSTAHLSQGSEVVGSGSGVPGLPERPGEMGGAAQSANYGGVQPNANYPYSAQPYNSYSSPYSRFGSSYNTPYGGLGGAYSGGYGGGLGGLGGVGGYGGYGGYGGMGMGMGQDPNQFNLVGAAAPSFAILESLIGAFSSFSQLLESTYHTTHSTFHALSSLYSQLGGLQSYFGRLLGIFSLVRLGRYLIRLIKGKGNSSVGGGAGGGWAEEWIGAGMAHPSQLGKTGPGSRRNETPRPSTKPLIFFLVSAVGLPYLMTKLVGLLTRIQQEQERDRLAALGLPPNVSLANGGAGVPNAATITFARAVHPFDATADGELALKRDEIVAILQRLDGNGREMGWWRGRTREGRIGWFPGNYVEILKRREPKEITAPPTMADPAKEKELERERKKAQA